MVTNDENWRVIAPALQINEPALAFSLSLGCLCLIFILLWLVLL